MENEINGSENGFTFDTCVVIEMLKNPNVGGLLVCRLNFENSDIHLCTQTIIEAERLGYDTVFISKQIQSITRTNVIIGSVTNDMQNDAKRLEKTCSDLHNGDSQILAYAKATETTLVTRDRGLAKSAAQSGVVAINPDLLACDEIAKNSRYSRTVKKAKLVAKKTRVHKIIKKANEKLDTKNKVESLILKPGEKIIWRSFN